MSAIAFESALMALAHRLVAQVRDGEPITLTHEQATAVATAILERAHMLWPERCGGAGWRPPALLDVKRAGVLGRDYPALDRWRRLVLGEKKDRWPLERAAAWELQALACDVAGDPYLAHRARLAAAKVVKLARSPHVA